MLPAIATTSLVPTTPAAPRSTKEQATLVAQITHELVASGLNPAAVVVNDTSTAILLPSGASAPIALPVNFSAVAGGHQAPSDNAWSSDVMQYATSPETIKTLKHADNVRLASDTVPGTGAGVVPAFGKDSPNSLEVDTSPTGQRSHKAAEPTYEVFVSHCKRTESSEDRAIWVSDIAEGDGLSVFFDRSDLTEISKDKLKESIEASRVVVTILDPFTFDSEWVTLENEWARDAGIPVVGMYDGDKFRWEQICKWKDDHPHVFARPVINYQKDYSRASDFLPLCASCQGGQDPCKKKKPARKQQALASPLPKKNPSSLVRIAVGKSTLQEPMEAVEKAWRHLVSKLGGFAPHMIVVAFTGKHDASALAAALAKTVAAGTTVVGVSAGLGIMFEDQWLSSADGSPAMTMWGIFDPQGAYEVVYEGSGLRSNVKAAVGAAVDAQITRGPPRFTLAYTTPTFEQSSINGVHDVIGESALLFGIGVSGPLGFAMVPENVPTVFALKGGQPFDPFQSLGCGLASVLCWPSVFIAGAFSPGGSCCKRPKTGRVTKVSQTGSMAMMTNPPAAFANASELRETPSDTCIVEIDGRPAFDVYREWLSEEERSALDAIMEGENVKTIDPSNIMEAMSVHWEPPAWRAYGQGRDGQDRLQAGGRRQHRRQLDAALWWPDRYRGGRARAPLVRGPEGLPRAHRADCQPRDCRRRLRLRLGAGRTHHRLQPLLRARRHG